MKLLALAGDIESLIAQVRLVAPLQALCQREGWPLALRSFHDCRLADLAAAEVLVVQRAMTARARRLQRRMRQQGGAVLYDIDDLLTEVAPHISGHATVQGRQNELRSCIAESDALSVSTALLVQMLGEGLALPPSVVVGNAAPAPSGLPLPAQTPGPVSLLLASSDRLLLDAVMPALRQAQGQGARIVAVGPPAQALAAAGLPVQAEPLRPREAFLAFARSLPNPVAVVPLEDTRFAAGKSAIKWFDYAEIGVPTLASAVSPYREVMDPGRTGWLVPNEPAAWMHALAAVCVDAPARLAVAAAARAAVRQEHRLDSTLDAWLQALRQAADEAQARSRGADARRHATPAALLQRALHALQDRLEDRLAGLRALNRVRLAQRQQKKQARSTAP
jgi:hypothetical protein